MFKSLLETDHTVGAKLASLVSCGKGVEQKSVACPHTIHLAAGLVPNLDEETIQLPFDIMNDHHESCFGVFGCRSVGFGTQATVFKHLDWDNAGSEDQGDPDCTADQLQLVIR